MQNGFRAIAKKQRDYIDDAKRRAMEPMSHHVRDRDNRPDSFVTGEIRPWTEEGWARFSRNKLPLWRRLFNALLPFHS